MTDAVGVDEGLSSRSRVCGSGRDPVVQHLGVVQVKSCLTQMRAVIPIGDAAAP
jgi:hypothetical protein